VKKILWLSRHAPLPVQVAELKRLFGEVEIGRDVEPFQSAERIAREYHKGDYDDMVIVAPLWVIAHLCAQGIKPLYADMEVVSVREQSHVEAAGRFYRFKRFRRIEAVEVKFSDL